MTSIAHKPAAFELRVREEAHSRDAPASRLSLRATEDGWSLVADDGQVVFRGFGLAGRRRCLEFARDQGVLVVLS
jgi:hypothetical protein